MFRCHQHRVGVRFHPDCPDHIKMRGMRTLFDTSGAADAPTRIPLCDREWVSRVDEKIPGWWFPFFGFVSDSRLRFIRSCVPDLLRKINPFRKN